MDKKERYKLIKKNYAQSEVGKERRKEWLQSEKGKEAVAKANRNYIASGKRTEWLQSENGKAYIAHVTSTEEEERRKRVNYGVADYIKSKRLENGFTRNELSQKIGVTLALVQKWENGRSLPTFEKLYPLAEAFGMKFKDFRKEIEPLIKEARRKSEESLKAKK